jgi:hypothetical protein
MRASLARIRRILNSNKMQNKDDDMSFEFTIPARRIEAIFGTGYPSARLNIRQRQNFLYLLLKKKFKMAEDEWRDNPSVSVAICRAFPFLAQVRVEVSGSEKVSYVKALAIEKYLWNIPRLGYVSPPRWWNRVIHRRPADMFLIEDDMIVEVVDWLRENCHHRDYQFISKFRTDITLGFRSEEAATLFKLTFGDKDLISKDAH